MTVTSSPLLLTAEQTRDLLGGDISTRSLWRWTANGLFPKPVRLGGRTLWKKKEVEQFINDADGDLKKLHQLKKGKP